MRYLLLLLACSLALPACAQRKLPRQAKATPAATKPTKTTPPEPVLVYQRTPCNGRCPVYTASIFADGRVEYDGQRYVPLLGKHTLSLPPATVAAILAEARRIGFDKLAERYAGNTSDQPVISLYYDEIIRLTQRNVRGLTANPMNQLLLERVRKE